MPYRTHGACRSTVRASHAPAEHCRTRSGEGSVERLSAGPATVGEATSGFGVSKPAISKHVKLLEETGVVTRLVEGRTHRLSLAPSALGEAAAWMDAQRAL